MVKGLKSPTEGLSFRHPLVILLLVGTAFYLLAYFLYPELPGAGKRRPDGWRAWSDQACYWRSAANLAQFRLDPEAHHYPLGYPLLGALFVRWMPMHAFLIPNLACFLGILLLFYRICREFVSPWESFAMGVVAILLPAKILTTSLVVPWNTTPVHLAIYAMIVLLAFGEPCRKRFFAAAALAAAVVWFRPADLVYLTPLFAVHLWRDARRGDWKECGVKAGFAAVAVAVSVGAMALVNWRIFGDVVSPYLQTHASKATLDGFFRKTYAVFVSATTTWNTSDPMLVCRFPWLLLALPGAVGLLRQDAAKNLGWIGAIAGCVLFLLTYNIFEAYNVFKYQLIRYWAWWIPLAALLAYVGVVKSWRWLGLRGVLLSALPCILLAAFVDLKQTLVAQEPLAIGAKRQVYVSPGKPFPGSVSKIVIPALQLPIADMHAVVIRRNGQTLRWFYDYAMDANDTGLIIVLRRDIARNDTLTVELDWPPAARPLPQPVLEAYRLEFGFRWRPFGSKDARWLDRLSLPPRVP